MVTPAVVVVRVVAVALPLLVDHTLEKFNMGSLIDRRMSSTMMRTGEAAIRLIIHMLGGNMHMLRHHQEVNEYTHDYFSFTSSTRLLLH